MIRYWCQAIKGVFPTPVGNQFALCALAAPHEVEVGPVEGHLCEAHELIYRFCGHIQIGARPMGLGYYCTVEKERPK